MKHTTKWAYEVGCVLALCAATALAAPAQQAGFLYPPPAPGAVTILKGVRYGPEPSIQQQTIQQQMDVYRPSVGSRAPHPALIFFNGTGLPRTNEMYAGWGRTAASNGLVAIVPELRPDSAAQDFQRLITHLTEHATSYGVDPEAIAVYAGSANVFTAFPIVEDPRQTAIKAAVMFYGTAPITQFRLDLPVLYVRAGLDRPSVNADTPSGIAGLATLAISQNAPVTLLNDGSGHHAFEIVDDDEVTRDVIDRTIDWVKRATARPYQTALRRGMPEATAAGQVLTGNFSAAVAAYATMVRTRPNDARLGLAYGEALLGDRQYAAACAEFEALKGKGLGPRDLGLPAARACAQKGDSETAIAWLRSIPQQFLPGEVADEPAFAGLQTHAEFRALFQPSAGAR